MNEEELEVKAKEYSVKEFDTVWNIAVKVYKAGYRACTKEIKQLGERCNQLLKDKGALLDKIEKMKCCSNCKNEGAYKEPYRYGTGWYNICKRHKVAKGNFDKWEIKEK